MEELVLAYSGASARWAGRAEVELEQVAETGASVVVDLTESEDIDSPTLGLLALAQKRLRLKGGELSLVCGRSAVLRQLRRTGLDRTFPLRAAG
jgi:anti-anti-sigma factor